MQIEKTQLDGVILIKPRVFPDDRGKFFELFQEKRYQEAGLILPFVQDNVSYSKQDTLRGLHYQLKHPQGKLVSVLKGRVLDIVVDIRLGSSRFGQAIAYELSDENHHQLYIPPGFAHGFYVLSESACFHYKCTDYYYADDQYGIAWNDASFHIPFPKGFNPILSEKDKQLPLLKETPVAHLPSIEKEKE